MNWKPFFIALSLIIVFLVYSPTPKGPHPQEYTPGEVTDLDSLSISLDRLANAKFIETPSEGPQDIEIDSRGNIYSGLSDGRIIKITADLSNITVIGKTQGRIFGVDLSRTEDRLAFCDQEEGIKIMDLKSGNIEAIVSKF